MAYLKSQAYNVEGDTVTFKLLKNYIIKVHVSFPEEDVELIVDDEYVFKPKEGEEMYDTHNSKEGAQIWRLIAIRDGLHQKLTKKQNWTLNNLINRII